MLNPIIDVDEANVKPLTNPGEKATINYLRGFYGIPVKYMGYYAPCDLTLRDIRIELKAASPRIGYKGMPFWAFNLHRHGELKEENYDFYIFRLEKVPFCTAAIHLMVPSPVGAKTFTASFRSLLGRDAAYLTRFHEFIRAERTK